MCIRLIRGILKYSINSKKQQQTTKKNKTATPNTASRRRARAPFPSAQKRAEGGFGCDGPVKGPQKMFFSPPGDVGLGVQGLGWMTSSYWPTSRRETARRRSGRTSRPRSRRSGARCGSFVPDNDEERLTDSEDEPVKRASPTSVPNCGRFANV